MKMYFGSIDNSIFFCTVTIYMIFKQFSQIVILSYRLVTVLKSEFETGWKV